MTPLKSGAKGAWNEGSEMICKGLVSGGSVRGDCQGLVSVP